MFIILLAWCSNNNYNNWGDYNNSNNTIEIDNSYDDSNYSQTSTKKKWDWITVKYRDTQVDISDFLTTNTSNSSFIENAYYDSDNEYLILKMNWTYYHRCEVPRYVWNDFKNADSKWTYYNKYIKWEYDCRYATIPIY